MRIMTIVFRKMQAITIFEARQYCSQQGWNLTIDDGILENNIERSQVKENKYNGLYARNVFL